MSHRALAGAGTAASAVVVFGMTQAGPGDDVLPPAGPLGSWQAADNPGTGYALLALLGMFAFILCFLGLYRMSARGELTVRQVAFTAVLWCVPVLFAHPLLSMDAY